MPYRQSAAPARRPGARGVGAVVTAVAALLAVGMPPSGTPALAVTATSTDRLAGPDRYATAAATAAAAFPDGAARAVLVRGDEFADGLAGAPLAGRNAPILLTRTDELPGPTVTALTRLGVDEVVVLGDSTAVSADVTGELERLGHRVRRIGGADRHATAIAVARALSSVGTVDGRRTGILVRGDQHADAALAGPLAARHRLPVLLTPPRRLHRQTAREIRALRLQQVLIIGSPEAVSRAVAQELRELGVRPLRVGGRDRADTSAQLAAWAQRSGLLAATTALLTRGGGFADAISSAPYAARKGAPLTFADTARLLGYDVQQWLVDRGGAVRRVVAIGSTAAVSNRVLRIAASAASTPRRTYTYSVRSLGEVRSDVAAFAEHVDWTLTDVRGWSLHHDLRFTRVRSGGDFTVNLASPAEVAAASPGCSATWSCRVGRDIYINDDRWRLGTASYADRPLSDYRHYVVLHEIGHWFGLGHTHCPAPGRPATVMQQQSKGLQGCTSNVWPLASELAPVRARALG